jgi:hypothetical protein
MPIRGIDPMGPAFFEMAGDWAAKGNPYYLPLPDTATGADDFDAEPTQEVDLAELARRIEESR